MRTTGIAALITEFRETTSVRERGDGKSQRMKLRLDKFAARHFEEAHFRNITQEEFMDRVLALGPQPLVDGYAPFCKHIFVRNFVEGLRAPIVPLTDELHSLVKTDYQARSEKELPVLVRWIEADSLNDADRADATWLDLILYSKEQIIEEAKSMGEEDDTSDIDYDWGIISIKPQNEPHELPMQPITALRNALGKEEGGSGVPLDKEKYNEAVAYWKEHIMVVH